MKLKVRPHATWFSFRAKVQWKIRLYIECIAGDSPKKNICDICERVCVCVFVMHICNASYLKIEFLTRSLDGGRPTQRKTSMEICIFFTCKWYEGFFFYYLRSPDICMLENILTSPPASRTDSTKLTYSFLRLTSWHLKARECKVGDKKYLRNFEAITIEILGKVYTYIFSYD